MSAEFKQFLECTLVSNNGTCFVSAEFKQFLECNSTTLPLMGSVREWCKLSRVVRRKCKVVQLGIAGYQFRVALLSQSSKASQ